MACLHEQGEEFITSYIYNVYILSWMTGHNFKLKIFNVHILITYIPF